MNDDSMRWKERLYLLAISERSRKRQNFPPLNLVDLGKTSLHKFGRCHRVDRGLTSTYRCEKVSQMFKSTSCRALSPLFSFIDDAICLPSASLPAFPKETGEKWNGRWQPPKLIHPQIGLVCKHACWHWRSNSVASYVAESREKGKTNITIRKKSSYAFKTCLGLAFLFLDRNLAQPWGGWGGVGAMWKDSRPLDLN